MDDVTTIRRVAQEGKDADPAWYRIHRRASIHITLVLLRAGLRPNQVSLLMMAVGAVGVVLMAAASPAANLAGFLALYLAFLLDKVDGEIARVRGEQSAHGILLDRFHHRLVEPGLFAAAAIHEFRITGSLTVLLAGPIIMLLANMIEENQHIAPYIFYKRTREGARFVAGAPSPGPGVRRLAALMRPLKAFRMLIVALPLVYATYLAEMVVQRPITAWYLMLSAAALAVYYLFQCWFYFSHQLDADLAAEAAAIDSVFGRHVTTATSQARDADTVASAPAPTEAPRPHVRTVTRAGEADRSWTGARGPGVPEPAPVRAEHPGVRRGGDESS